MAHHELDCLYSDIILDHYHNPRNHQSLKNPDLSSHSANPFCGDEVSLQIILESGQFTQVAVQAIGCSINRAAASMLSEFISGKSVEEIEVFSKLFRLMMNGVTLSSIELKQLKDLQTLSRVRRFKIRIKCALLPWLALEDATSDYRKVSLDIKNPSLK